MSEEGQPERDPFVWVETLAGQEIHRFKEAYETQYSAVYDFVLRRLFGSHEDAADVTAEVFATAWRRVAHIPRPPEDRLWLFGVARRTLSRHQRGRKRRALLLRRLQTEAELWKRSELDSTNAQSDRER